MSLTEDTGGTEEVNRITQTIVDAALRLHKELGPRLLESVYEAVLADVLQAAGLRIERQKLIPITFEGKTFEEGFRADLVVQDCVLVELKCVEQLVNVHRKQVLTYIRLGNLRVGLLINFGGELLKGNLERFVLGSAPNLKKPFDRKQ